MGKMKFHHFWLTLEKSV